MFCNDEGCGVGGEFPDNYVFCPYCGEELDDEKEEVEADA